MTTDERAKLRRDARTVAEVVRMDGHPKLAAMIRELANDHENIEWEAVALRAELDRLASAPASPGREG